MSKLYNKFFSLIPKPRLDKQIIAQGNFLLIDNIINDKYKN